MRWSRPSRATLVLAGAALLTITTLLTGPIAGASAAGIVTAPADVTFPGDEDVSSERSTLVGRVHAASAAADDPVVEVQWIVDQRGEPADEVYVTLRYDLPDVIVDFRVLGVPADTDSGARVVATSGFTAAGAGNWTWDESTSGPSITVRHDLPTDRLTRSDRGTAGENWAFLSLSGPSHEGSYSGERPEFSDEARVRGEGMATDVFAYLGPYGHYSRAVAGQTLHLSVPASADPSPGPTTLLDYYADASRRLEIGGRDDHVYGFAIPSTDRTVSPVGATRGNASFYVAARHGAHGGETWVHEYVHTRQAFRTAPSARWLTEGSAAYYGVVLRAHSENWTTERLYRRIDGDRSGTLTEPRSWHELTPYVEGRQFVARLNLRLRRATDGEVTVTAVMRDLNAVDGRVTHEEFVGTLRQYDAGVAAWADRTLRSGESLSAPRDPAAYLFHGSEPDRDGLDLTAEERLGTSPFATDTDGDGVPDGRDECPVVAGDGDRGCPVSGTRGGAENESTTAGRTGESVATTSARPTGATGPVGLAPLLAVVAVALLARALSRRR